MFIITKVASQAMADYDEETYVYHFAGTCLGLAGSLTVVAICIRHRPLLIPFSRKLIFCQSVCDGILNIVFIAIPPSKYTPCIIQGFLAQVFLLATILWPMIIMYILLRATTMKPQLAPSIDAPSAKQLHRLIGVTTSITFLVACLPLTVKGVCE